MPTLSILTAVAPERTAHLAQAAESVFSQQIPDGWQVEWIICIDGAAVPPGLPPTLDDPRCHVVAAGRRVGPGGCRNVAALYATGSVFKNLDADDILLAGALFADIQTLSDSAELGWTTSEALDLLPDGRQVAFTTADADRIVPVGQVVDVWSRQPILDIHPTTLAIRADLFWRAGGYAAFPISEDVVLLSRANTIAPGKHRVEPSLLYRKWTGQVTAEPKPASYDLIRARMTEQLCSDQHGGANRSFGK